MNETDKTMADPRDSDYHGNVEQPEATFDAWWHNEGSGLPPLPGEDAETHVRRVCKIAWMNGTNAEISDLKDQLQSMSRTIHADA